MSAASGLNGEALPVLANVISHQKQVVARGQVWIREGFSLPQWFNTREGPPVSVMWVGVAEARASLARRTGPASASSDDQEPCVGPAPLCQCWIASNLVIQLNPSPEGAGERKEGQSFSILFLLSVVVLFSFNPCARAHSADILSSQSSPSKSEDQKQDIPL